MTQTNEKTLLTLHIKHEVDVVLARRRARQIAYLLGFDSANQTRISTAVSEIARNAYVHANGGRLDFKIDDSKIPCDLVIVLADKGPGFANLDSILSGRSDHVGLIGASRLVDRLSTANLEGGGAVVRLEKEMLSRQQCFTDAEINELANSLNKLMATSPIDEVHQQNQELLVTLDDLTQKQNELDHLNLTLAEKNLNLSSLNEEMQLLNNSLEEKVRKRTNELQGLNSELLVARDEAVLANQLKSQFVANISHEIRTPMSGILSSTELFLDSNSLGANLDEEARTLVTIAHDSAKGLMTILNDLLDFSKLEAGKLVLQESNFYMTSVVDDVVNSVSSAACKKSLRIENKLADSLQSRELFGDSLLLKRVLLNLVHNAVKFTEDGVVKIDVAVKEDSGDKVVVRGSVSDTGIGIGAADKSRLFQPFVQADGSNTRKYGGTGLGLSICHGYVSLMGGTIGVDSTKDKGSEFWFQVPLRVAQG
jgi:signal transduction histidine kinase